MAKLMERFRVRVRASVGKAHAKSEGALSLDRIRVAGVLLAGFVFGLTAYAQAPSTGPVQELAPGVISTGHGFTVTFSREGQNAWFTARDTEAAGEDEKPPLHIYQTHFANGAWQVAKPVAFSSGRWSDLDPFVTVDGSRMYFVSTRPAPGKDGSKPDMDIWYSEQKNEDWQEPHWISEVNSSAKEGSPSLDRRNNLYFFSDRDAESNHNSIYIAKWNRGHFSPPQKLAAEINAGPSDTSPWIAPDGKTLLFYSRRAGGQGQADLYASFRSRGGWSKALNLGPVVNTADFEYNPSVSRDGKTLYFGRGGRIYEVEVEALHVPELNRRRF
jgi:Tol biopolymer transport system component